MATEDSTAVQDGFQLYMHNFVLSDEGDWTVVQQGMNAQTKTARRYHWSSENLKSFVETPHTGITGEQQEYILNLTDSEAKKTRSGILVLSKENPDKVMKEVALIKDCTEKEKGTILKDMGTERNIILPAHHEVRAEDVDLKRLGGVLATAYASDPSDFESLLLTPGLGPRTLQSLTLVSEIINGTPSRFKDPARYSFAHGGKDGHPFPVPLKVYDESIRVLGSAIERSKLGYKDKSDCINRLHKTALEIERNCQPIADFDKTIERERKYSAEWGGKTVGGSIN